MAQPSNISGVSDGGTTPVTIIVTAETEIQLSLVQIFLLILFGLMFLIILVVYIKREVLRVSSRRAGLFDTQMAPGASEQMRDEIWKRVAVICGWKVFPKKLMSEAKRQRFEQEIVAGAGETANAKEKVSEKEAEANRLSYYYRMRAVDSVIREFQQLNPTVYRSLIDVLGTLYELLREQACVSEINDFLRAFNRARCDPDRFDRVALESFEAALHKMCMRIRADRPAVCTGELLENYRKRIALHSAGESETPAQKTTSKRADRDRVTRGRVRKLSIESGSSQVGLLGAQPQASSIRSAQTTSGTTQPTTSISRRSDPSATYSTTKGESENFALADLNVHKSGLNDPITAMTTTTSATITTNTSAKDTTDSTTPTTATNQSLDGDSAELIAVDTRVRSRKWKHQRAARTTTDESDDERRVVMTAFEEDEEEPGEI